MRKGKGPSTHRTDAPEIWLPLTSLRKEQGRSLVRPQSTSTRDEPLACSLLTARDNIAEELTSLGTLN
ncbi:hypothetical protein BHE90_013275 [Fusarium euwallaceae]|uniref:Uncharacterized protein n=1 Tax=Fusarium euwallaceae TaxID=1147111 RepID=A0A430L999_9HYPO|nr:hypothetical protein BHE90_013275 [Fusarium euwallaceae]